MLMGILAARTQTKKTRNLSMNNKSEAKFLKRAIELEKRDSEKGCDVGYMCRLLVQASMPYKKMDATEFIRKNGNYTLSMVAESAIGLPYGSLPRLIMAWISREAFYTQKRELSLGSLTSFMRALDIKMTGGKSGSIDRVKDQLLRLFNCGISYRHVGDKEVDRIKLDVAEDFRLWKPQTDTFNFPSKLLLGARFFNEMVTHHVPMNLGAYKVLSESPLAMDMYLWLTHKMFNLNDNEYIHWSRIKDRFGHGYANNSKGKLNFNRKFLEALGRVEAVYSELEVERSPYGVILIPSPTHVKRLIVHKLP